MSRQLLFIAICSAMITIAGCGGSGDSGDSGGENGSETQEEEANESESSSSSSSSSASSVEEAGENWAKLSGTVKLKGEKPEPTIQSQNLSDCKLNNGDTEKLEVPTATVGDDNGVKNVFVWVEPVEGSIPALKPEMPSSKATIDQKGCAFHPRSLIVATGGKLTVTNSDAGGHNFNYKGGNFWKDNINQDKGAEDTIDVAENPQFVTYECNIHPWMGGLFRISGNHAIGLSSKDGSFTIGSVPPGEYKVKVHHRSISDPVEKGTVTVTEDGSVEGLDLSGLQLEISG